jgi:1-aminocyclopropane-1-carboxylate deaminase
MTHSSPALSLSQLNSSTLIQHAYGVVHQQLHWKTFDNKKLSVYLRRDDLASEHYPGNKWYKLFYNLQAILAAGHKTVVSFGGAYSNHIHALAAMGQQYGLNTVGIIRGYKPKTLSSTLHDAESCGMRLLFLEHSAYRNKDISQFSDLLAAEYGGAVGNVTHGEIGESEESGESGEGGEGGEGGDGAGYYCLPEGGDNPLGIKGCQAIGQAIQQHFSGDYTVCCAAGTGTTLAGIISAMPEHIECLGFSALKGEDTLSAHITQRLEEVECYHQQWRIINDYHHGGYAKTTPELLQFMVEMEAANNVLLEPVYSAKMLWGIDQLAQADYWPQGSTVVAVHGGGIQGRRGFDLPVL